MTGFVGDSDVPDDEYYIHDLAFSPDGKLLVSRDFDNNMIRPWSVEKGKLLQKIEQLGESPYFKVLTVLWPFCLIASTLPLLYMVNL